MAKPTREQGISFINVRLLLMRKAATRQDLELMADVARLDLNLMRDHWLISDDERVSYACQISRAVEQRLADLLPVVPGYIMPRPVPSIADDQLRELMA